MTKALRVCAVAGLFVSAEAGGTLAQVPEMIVTARKREEQLQEVPVSVSAFSGDQLKRSGVEEFFDLQRVTPNLQFTQDFSAGASAFIVIRGQSQAETLLTTDASVGVYIDGVNLPRTLGFRSNNFDIERVEVLKGPQGTLYGRNTTAGAINVVTRKASHDGFGGFAEVTAGSKDRLDYAAAINVPLVPEKVALRLSGQRTSHSGYGKDLASGRELSDENRWFGRASVRFDPWENVNVIVTGDWQQIREAPALIKLRAIGASPIDDPTHITAAMIQAGIEAGVADPFTDGFGALAPFVGGDLHEAREGGFFFDGRRGDGVNSYDEWGTGATVTIDLDFATLKSISGYRRFQRNGRIDLDATPYTILHPNLFALDRFFSQEVQMSGAAANERLTWLVGGYYSNEKGTDGSRTIAVADINPANPSILDGDNKSSSWAIFSENSFALTDRLNFTFGGRYTKESKSLVSRNKSGDPTFPDPFDDVLLCDIPPGGVPVELCKANFDETFSGWSWLFGFDYHLAEDVLVYAKTSRGFRGGGQNLRGTRDPESFLAFKPEFARDVEVGLKSDWLDRRLRINVAGFWTDYKDVQRAVIVPAQGGNIVTAITNAAAATVLGFELETVLSPVEGLTLDASVGFTRPEYDEFRDIDPATGLPLDRSSDPFGTPRWQIGAGGRYECPVFDGAAVLGVQANWYWQSLADNVLAITDPTFSPDDVNIPAYGLLNLRTDVQLPAWDLELAVFVHNALDKEYYTGTLDLSSLGYLLGSSGDPRTWGVRLTKKFGAE